MSNIWQPVNIGEGGFTDGMDVVADGTMVVRTDTYGAYIWNGSQWQQLVTSTSMPAAFVEPNLVNQGVYEIQIAASNSNIMYMMFDGYVFKTTNKGTTWTETSFAQVTADPNDGYRWYGQKMAIDPNNPNIVYVGTPLNGLFVTTNGGSTWQRVSGVPASVASNGDSPGITGIEFDPANTNIIFAASYGNGVYETTNGGATWSQLTNGGGPSSVQSAAISSTGVYYAVGNNDAALWSYANGAWTELLSGSVSAVAINPSNPNDIVVANNADNLNQSLNGGVTWQGWDTNATVSTGDIPWLTELGPWVSPDELYFNPLNPDELLASGNDGFWNVDVPQTSTTPIVWTSQGVGIEQLVANEIIVPPGGNPVVASWDRGFFYISNPQTVASTFGPVTTTISAGWSIDYASSNPSFLVGISDGAYVNTTTEESGYSTNGGQTWTLFPSDPPGVGSGNAYQGPWAGSIAASTPNNILWAPANGNQPYYTLNGGESWNAVVLPGVSSWAGFQGEFYDNDRDITADRVLSNTFYLVFDTKGVFKTTNGGASWTQVYVASAKSGPFYYNSADESIQTVPGEAGNLFYTAGIEGATNNPFYRSTDGGVTWNAVANVDAVDAFGFGAAAPGQSYPAIYIVGWVNNVYGIWQSINNAQSWTQVGTYPDNSLDEIKTISGNPNVFGEVYVGFAGSGYAYLSADSSSTNLSPTAAPQTDPPTAAPHTDPPTAAPQTDGSPPAQPKITGFAREEGRSIKLNGTAEADSTVTIYDNGTAIGSTTANAQGKWSYTTGKMPTGAAVFTATATDAVGTSSQSMQSKYLPLKSEQLQQGLNSDRAAFAFDFPTLGYSPNRNRQGATLLVSEGNQSGVLALFGSYMASSFTLQSVEHGAGTVIIAEANAANPSLLAGPHRT